MVGFPSIVPLWLSGISWLIHHWPLSNIQTFLPPPSSLYLFAKLSEVIVPPKPEPITTASYLLSGNFLGWRDIVILILPMSSIFSLFHFMFPWKSVILLNLLFCPSLTDVNFLLASVITK